MKTSLSFLLVIITVGVTCTNVFAAEAFTIIESGGKQIAEKVKTFTPAQQDKFFELFDQKIREVSDAELIKCQQGVQSSCFLAHYATVISYHLLNILAQQGVSYKNNLTLITNTEHNLSYIVPVNMYYNAGKDLIPVRHVSNNQGFSIASTSYFGQELNQTAWIATGGTEGIQQLIKKHFPKCTTYTMEYDYFSNKTFIEVGPSLEGVEITDEFVENGCYINRVYSFWYDQKSGKSVLISIGQDSQFFSWFNNWSLAYDYLLARSITFLP